MFYEVMTAELFYNSNPRSTTGSLLECRTRFRTLCWGRGKNNSVYSLELTVHEVM